MYVYVLRESRPRMPLLTQKELIDDLKENAFDHHHGCSYCSWKYHYNTVDMLKMYKAHAKVCPSTTKAAWKPKAPKAPKVAKGKVMKAMKS